jgi:hypothetical protein
MADTPNCVFYWPVNGGCPELSLLLTCKWWIPRTVSSGEYPELCLLLTCKWWMPQTVSSTDLYSKWWMPQTVSSTDLYSKWWIPRTVSSTDLLMVNTPNCVFYWPVNGGYPKLYLLQTCKWWIPRTVSPRWWRLTGPRPCWQVGAGHSLYL